MTDRQRKILEIAKNLPEDSIERSMIENLDYIADEVLADMIILNNVVVYKREGYEEKKHNQANN